MNLSDREQLLASMPPAFTRKQWMERAKATGVPANTASSWLQRMDRQGTVVYLKDRKLYVVAARRDETNL